MVACEVSHALLYETYHTDPDANPFQDLEFIDVFRNFGGVVVYDIAEEPRLVD